MLTVSLYSQQGQSGSSITGHPGSRTTSWFVSGNKVNATAFSGTSSVHWYVLCETLYRIGNTDNAQGTLSAPYKRTYQPTRAL
jgi:hypothetical protein